MSSRSPQQGFAIALLLWMIAGMSLMVAAVIHFARADIGLAELRLEEARHQALGRGLALLAMRDAAMPREPDSGFENGADAVSKPDSALFTLNLTVDSDINARAVVRPASGYISINDAGADELVAFFTYIGRVDAERASLLADEALAVRQMHPGFRYVEELLELPSLKLGEYALLKAHAQPYRTGSLQVGMASSKLKQAFDADGEGGYEGMKVPPIRGGGGSATGPDQMTFEAIAEDRRRNSSRSDSVINAVEIEINGANGERTTQVVWVSPHVGSKVLRSGPVRRAAGEQRP